MIAGSGRTHYEELNYYILNMIVKAVPASVFA